MKMVMFWEGQVVTCLHCGNRSKLQAGNAVKSIGASTRMDKPRPYRLFVCRMHCESCKREFRFRFKKRIVKTARKA